MRKSQGKRYGLVLVPDGLLSHTPEIVRLISELAELTVDQGRDRTDVMAMMSPWTGAVFEQFPRDVQYEFISACDLNNLNSHGSVDWSSISTERLLEYMVSNELERRSKQSGVELDWNCVTDALSYVGRGAQPNDFDCDLGYTCGYSAGILVDGGKTGLLVSVTGLDKTPETWRCGGVPLASLVNITGSLEGSKLVMEPKDVRLHGDSCKALTDCMPLPAERHAHHPGPTQFLFPLSNKNSLETVRTFRLMIASLASAQKQLVEIGRLTAELKAEATRHAEAAAT